MVSIAGAILWGVLRVVPIAPGVGSMVFQSQGRFFGGCCDQLPADDEGDEQVSIAGAILWGVLQTIDASGGLAEADEQVSIAGAILWGVLPRLQRPGRYPGRFQSQGRFFGGCCAHYWLNYQGT